LLNSSEFAKILWEKIIIPQIRPEQNFFSLMNSEGENLIGGETRLRCFSSKVSAQIEARSFVLWKEENNPEFFFSKVFFHNFSQKKFSQNCYQKFFSFNNPSVIFRSSHKIFQ